MGHRTGAADDHGFRRRGGEPDAVTGRASDESKGLLADSRTVAIWTLVSRITGFGRVAIMAAVLGPTYFGNIFQTTALLPAMLFSLLGGSLVGAVLVPSLVDWVDGRDRATLRRLANGFLGIMLPVLLIVAVLIILIMPSLLALATAAVDDPHIRLQQQHVGCILLLMLLPQLLLYGVAAAGMAVQHAHGHFAIAAAAPVIENAGSIVVLGTSALTFGVGAELGDVGTAQLVLLGAGTTTAVGLHAVVQWWGAYRAGVPLVPWAGWRYPEVRQLVCVAFTSSGYTGLYNLVSFAIIIVAGSIPGGVIAFQIGQNFAFLPVALGAVPLASAQLPRLSRCFNEENAAAFRSTFRESFAFSRFLTLPAGFLLVAMADSFARAVAFGEMTTPVGIAMIAACIGSQGVGVFGEASTVLLTSAAYARRDGSAPLRAMVLRAVVALSGTGLALAVMDGMAILWTLGLSLSAANLAAAAYQYRALMGALPPAPGRRGPRFLGDLGSSAISMMLGGLVALWLHGDPGNHAEGIGIALAGSATGGILYLALQRARGSHELISFLSILRGARGGLPRADDGNWTQSPSKTPIRAMWLK